MRTLKAKKTLRITQEEIEALLSAIYTQMDAIKAGPKNGEASTELKHLRKLEKLLRGLQ